jgi:hypothetical protein
LLGYCEQPYDRRHHEYAQLACIERHKRFDAVHHQCGDLEVLAAVRRPAVLVEHQLAKPASSATIISQVKAVKIARRCEPALVTMLVAGDRSGALIKDLTAIVRP